VKEIKALIQKAINEGVKQNPFIEKVEIVITFVTNKEIKEYNKRFRNIDQPTDVLSFPALEWKKQKPILMPGDIEPNSGFIFLGDVVISLEMAKKQAKEYGHSLYRECAFLAVHGLLHLLGYDHDTKKKEQVMIDKQEQVLNQLELQRN
jgi:probable rRNA maturation factor